jgi:hypothetical protein
MPKAKGAYAFPQRRSMIETFLETTRIFLFGKPFPTLRYDPEPKEFEASTVSAPISEENLEAEATVQVDVPMPPGPVEEALRKMDDEGIFARIYGFSFEGHYYKMPRPLLFLVRNRGSSRRPEEPVSGEFSTRLTGVEAKDWQFGSDIRVWAVDKHEIAFRLDIEIGPYDEVLLQSLAAGREESAFRTAAYSRSAAYSQSMMLGPHQER